MTGTLTQLEKFWERANYVSAVAWMYSLGLIPSIIKGFTLWKKANEKQKRETLGEIVLLFLWGFIISLVCSLLSWCPWWLPAPFFILLAVSASSMAIWQGLDAFHGDGEKPNILFLPDVCAGFFY